MGPKTSEKNGQLSVNFYLSHAPTGGRRQTDRRGSLEPVQTRRGEDQHLSLVVHTEGVNKDKIVRLGLRRTGEGRRSPEWSPERGHSVVVHTHSRTVEGERQTVEVDGSHQSSGEGAGGRHPPRKRLRDDGGIPEVPGRRRSPLRTDPHKIHKYK